MTLAICSGRIFLSPAPRANQSYPLSDLLNNGTAENSHKVEVAGFFAGRPGDVVYSLISRQQLLPKGNAMTNFSKGVCVLLALVALSGCHHRSSAVGHDGRPHAPGGQQAPGGTLGAGPVGQPQS